MGFGICNLETLLMLQVFVHVNDSLVNTPIEAQ